MTTVTPFDPKRHHIHVHFYVTGRNGHRHSLDGIVDTGAPKTEFSDEFLTFAGFVEPHDEEILLKKGLQTQKYGKVALPLIEICGQTIEKFEVFTSRFEEGWGIDALIGLDFFRKFRVTIDYSSDHLVTEALLQSPST